MPYTLSKEPEDMSMLNPKEAVEKAQQHLVEFIPDLADRGIRMEEIEPFGDNWRITFSALSPPLPENAGTIAEILRPTRIHKVVEVRAEDGSFVSVRNRA